jgi:hypothetical protein
MGEKRMCPSVNNKTGSGQGMNPNGGLNWNEPTENDMLEAQAAEQAYSLGENKSSNRNTMLLLGICLSGIVVVYLLGMRQNIAEPTAEQKAAEAQIDAVLGKLVQKDPALGLLNDTENMVKTFYEYPSNQQVALQDLKKNPFSRLAEAKATAQAPETKTRAQIEKELEVKLADLELQSVVQSSHGAKCLINGEVYGKGQVVADIFRISNINVNSVVVVAEEFEFVLRM